MARRARSEGCEPPGACIPEVEAAGPGRSVPRRCSAMSEQAVPEPGFGMAELCRRSGLPAGTLRHYMRKGLLPAPCLQRENRFLYDERHVEAARLVRQLRTRRGASLGQIAAVLPDLLRMPSGQAFRPEMWDALVPSRSRRRRDVRARLLEAATAAFSCRGFAEVRVDDVCRAAGLAKGTFYLHFRSKEELYERAAEAVVNQMIAELGRARVSAEVLELALSSRLPLLLDLLSLAARQPAGHAPMAARVFARLRHGVRGVMGADASDEEATEAIGTAMLASLGRILSGQPSGRPLTAAASAERMM